jgi:hypothetical protein
MSRMIDLIRSSEVSANLVQAAARGSLSVPPGEMIEILVHLALHSKTFGNQARITLAGWDEKASLAAARDPATSAEVLGYFASPANLRPQLLPALAENPSVSDPALCELAGQGGRSVVGLLLASPRVTGSRELLRALESNPTLRPNELAEIASRLAALETSAAVAPAAVAHPAETEAPTAVLEEALTNYLKENAVELEAETDKPFEPVGGIHDDAAAGVATDSVAPAATPAVAPAATSAPEAHDAPGVATAAAHAKKHLPPSHDERRDSTLQKIAKLDIKGRIALAVRGNKEERSILIRDGTKLVALAVLDSPKVTDGEVEGFASQKNVLEAVLRTIPLKRRFLKNYIVTKNLVFNPRTPLDVSLGLMKHLLVHDLKNLSGNKEVADTVRKLALRMFRQKLEKKTSSH